MDGYLLVLVLVLVLLLLLGRRHVMLLILTL